MNLLTKIKNGFSQLIDGLQVIFFEKKITYVIVNNFSFVLDNEDDGRLEIKLEPIRTDSSIYSKSNSF